MSLSKKQQHGWGNFDRLPNLSTEPANTARFCDSLYPVTSRSL